MSLVPYKYKLLTGKIPPCSLSRSHICIKKRIKGIALFVAANVGVWPRRPRRCVLLLPVTIETHAEPGYSGGSIWMLPIDFLIYSPINSSVYPHSHAHAITAHHAQIHPCSRGGDSVIVESSARLSIHRHVPPHSAATHHYAPTHTHNLLLLDSLLLLLHAHGKIPV